jgi:DNA-binding ferritin-like protein
VPEFHLPLAAEDRGVAAELQAALVDRIDLALIGKQAHSYIAGPHCRWVHSELDEPADKEARHASAGGMRDLGARTPPRRQP